MQSGHVHFWFVNADGFGAVIGDPLGAISFSCNIATPT